MENQKVAKKIANQLFIADDKKKLTGDFDIEIKKVTRHLHYIIGMNSSQSYIFFSTFFAFFSRENKTKIRHCIGLAINKAKKDSPSIQMMYLGRDTGNLVIVQTISVSKITKKELTEKISFLLEQIKIYWPFKY
jgi:hypothetical protein